MGNHHPDLQKHKLVLPILIFSVQMDLFQGPRYPRTEKIHPNCTLFQVLIYIVPVIMLF